MDVSTATPSRTGISPSRGSSCTTPTRSSCSSHRNRTRTVPKASRLDVPCVSSRTEVGTFGLDGGTTNNALVRLEDGVLEVLAPLRSLASTPKDDRPLGSQPYDLAEE